MNNINLASPENAKKINQRFKELEGEINQLKEAQVIVGKTLQTMNAKLDSQMELYRDFFVKQYGTGPTERSENAKRIPRIYTKA